MSSKQLMGLTLGSLIVVVAVVAALITAFGALNPKEESAPTSEAHSPTLEERGERGGVDKRPDCPQGPVGGVDLPCLGGEATTVLEEDAITVVNVWAWWCGPCREELPLFDAYQEQNPQLTVVGVQADTNPGNGAALLNELGSAMPSYQDSDNRFAGTLGLPGVIPLTVVLRGQEMVAMFPRTFHSVAEISAAVDAALVG